MVIDQGGALRPSRHAYDKRVAGVISGGGDMKPGTVLDRKSPGLTSLQRLDLAGCDQLRHRAPPSACNASTSEGYQGRSPISVNLFETSRKTFVLATYARVAAPRGLSRCFANY